DRDRPQPTVDPERATPSNATWLQDSCWPVAAATRPESRVRPVCPAQRPRSYLAPPRGVARGSYVARNLSDESVARPSGLTHEPELPVEAEADDVVANVARDRGQRRTWRGYRRHQGERVGRAAQFEVQVFELPSPSPPEPHLGAAAEGGAAYPVAEGCRWRKRCGSADRIGFLEPRPSPAPRDVEQCGPGGVADAGARGVEPFELLINRRAEDGTRGGLDTELAARGGALARPLQVAFRAPDDRPGLPIEAGLGTE